eukprot:1191598-Prorocentrum_minimum.AAC.3
MHLFSRAHLIYNSYSRGLTSAFTSHSERLAPTSASLDRSAASFRSASSAAPRALCSASCGPPLCLVQ